MLNALFQAMFFFSTGVFAISISIYVFAVSLLGRAIKSSTKNREATLLEAKKLTEDKLRAVVGSIEKASTSEDIQSGLVVLNETRRQLRMEDTRLQKKLKDISRAADLLTLKGGLLPQSFWLTVALVAAIVGWGLTAGAVVLDYAVLYGLIVVSVLSAVVGLYRIYLSLKSIEDFAIMSDGEAT